MPASHEPTHIQPTHPLAHTRPPPPRPPSTAAAAAAAAAATVPHDDELERDVLAHSDGFGFEMSTFAGLMNKSASSAVPMHDSFGAISSSSESDDLEDQGLTSHDDNSDSDDNTDGIALPDYMVMPKLELGNSSEEELCYQGQDANGMPRLCYDRWEEHAAISA